MTIDKLYIYLFNLIGLRVLAGLINFLSTLAIVYFANDNFSAEFFFLLAVGYIISVLSRGGTDISIVKKFSSKSEYCVTSYQTVLILLVFLCSLILSSIYFFISNILNLTNYNFEEVVFISLSIGFMSIIVINGFFDIASFRSKVGLIHQYILLPVSIILCSFLLNPDFKACEFFFLATLIALISSYFLTKTKNKNKYKYKKNYWSFYVNSFRNLPLLTINILITWGPIYFSGILLEPTQGSDFAAIVRILASITMVNSAVSTYYSPRWAKMLSSDQCRECKMEWQNIIKVLSLLAILVILLFPVIHYFLDYFLNFSILDSWYLVLIIVIAHAYSLAMAPCGAILTMSGNVMGMFFNNSFSIILGWFTLFIETTSKPIELALCLIFIVSLCSNSLNFFAAKKVLS